MKALGELTVQDLMTHPASCIGDTDRLTDAIRTMDQNSFSLMPVVDAQGSLAGILSTSDLLGRFYRVQSDLNAMNVANESLRELLIQIVADESEAHCVRDVMETNALSIAPETNAVVAARMMIENGIHHLPVVDEKKRPIGMLATTDYVRAFANHGVLLAG